MSKTEDEGRVRINDVVPNYSSVHGKIRYKYGSASFCVFCVVPSVRYEWANVTGDYTDDIEDYLPMCARCHRVFDVTDETRLKHSQFMTGRVNAPTKAVNQIKDGRVIATFESVAEAARQTTGHRPGIIYTCKGKALSSGGYQWEYAE